MSQSHRVSKPWGLRSKETLTSFENWKSNILYNLRQDSDFSPFVKKTVTWTKKKTNPKTRGLTATTSKSAEERADDLESMLGCIANWSTWVRRKTIVENCKSLEEVWQAIRLHYGFNTSGANFLDFTDIKLEPEEREEDLYTRMAAFIDDNLLKKEGSLTHDGEEITEDEETTPTLENLLVLLWLEKLHPRLPTLVKQKYATELRSKTLFSLKPEISMTIPSLLEEARNAEDAKVMRLGGSKYQHQSYSGFKNGSKGRPKKSGDCALCKQAGRNANHYLSQCRFLPESDRKFMAKTRRIMGVINDDQESDREDEDEDEDSESDQDLSRQERRVRRAKVSKVVGKAMRVMIKSCPFFNVFFGPNPVVITLDCGAEVDLIRKDVCLRIGVVISKSDVSSITQADRKTPLTVCGEAHIKFTRGDLELFFSGLVVEELDGEVLGSVPFMSRNNITYRSGSDEIEFSDGTVIDYQPVIKSHDSVIRRSTLVRAPDAKAIWPGEYAEFDLSESLTVDMEMAVEPRGDTKHHDWIEPAIVRSVNNKIRIPNSTNEVKYVKKHDHVLQISPVFSPTESTSPENAPSSTTRRDTQCESYTNNVSVDPDHQLDPNIREAFIEANFQHQEVFNPNYKGYNHAFGSFEAVVNIGNVKPPQRKGKMPQYSRDKLVIVQEHFDKLESLGVLAKPEEIGVNVEYLNPSFLVKKSDNNFRLVTAFTEVGKYCKPQPTLLPTIDSTLRNIARWKYIVTSDLKSAYFQIPLSKDSMKYCGTVSPFKGTRVYTRCAMGMPGSETALEELLCRILGDLITKGSVTKIADDLYVGGETQEDLLDNWKAVLQCFSTADIRLTGSKTIIAPKEATILGWIWREGTLKASPHKIASLSACPQPTTVKEMRSFLGAYKVLARVIPKCSTFLQPLSRATAGKASHSKIEWTENLIKSFKLAQNHLSSNHIINLPKESDQLIIVTDGATAQPAGIGSTLYVIRETKPQIAGFFSQQLKPEQSTNWFPCEIEGLSIAAAVKFFSVLISQSRHTTQILTDSKPCCEAYQKLCRGEFSTNARLSTFLTTVSRHHVSISHLSGAANLPSDFGSRNPVSCSSDRCQVCQFVVKLDASVVRGITVNDVKTGTVPMPFTSRKAWIATQSECPDLRRVKAQLQQGTRPSKKETKIPNVKRYLNKVTIANDGLLVVRKSDPLCPSREAIVVPSQIISGLVTALHIKFDHPSTNELLTITDRSFYALNLSKVVEEVTKSCHTCASLAKVPKSLVIQSSSDPPEVIGSQYACDIMKRERQMIMIIREYVSSYTFTTLIQSEGHVDLRDNLIKLLVGFIPLEGPKAVVRVDPASGFKALINDPLLTKHRIHLDIGLAKNINKNPVAERAIQELEEIIQHHDNHNKAIDDSTLAIITARINNKIRTNGLSAREILTQRDQFSHTQLPLQDKEIIFQKHASSLKAHHSSELSKSNGQPTRQPPSLAIGDLVHLISDKSKHHPRERYIVTSIEGNWCQVRKFVGSQLRANPYKVPLNEVYRVPSQTPPILKEVLMDSDLDEDQSPPAEKAFQIPREISEIPNRELERESITENDNQDIEQAETSAVNELSDNNNHETDIEAQDSPPVAVQPRRSSRAKRPPVRFKDYE